jgi:hypothetical protein
MALDRHGVHMSREASRVRIIQYAFCCRMLPVTHQLPPQNEYLREGTSVIDG